MAELVPIRVSELPEVTTAADSDYLVIDNGTQTSRITSENYNATASESAKHYANEALLSAQNAELQAGAASDSADAAENKAQEANASAQDAEAWAAGKRNGADVPSTDEAYHNNAKYFSEQAHTSATESASSADDAAQSAASISGLADQIEQNTEDITDLKSALYEIREPGENLCYINSFAQTSLSGLSIAWNGNDSIKIWGTASSWVRFNCLMGNTEIATSSYPTYTNNLSAGTYTLDADDLLYVFYGTSWDTRTRWDSGTSITLENAVCVYLSTKTNSQAFGTEQAPSIFHIAIYQGNVNVVPTAKDTVARGQITKDLGDLNCDRVMAKGDFDYARPYNIFNGTEWTPNKKVNYLDGVLSDDTGRYVTDYIEIDPAQEYLCINIYVRLSGETDDGIITGGNRVWVHTNWAFYDSNKQYIRGNASAELNSTSKTIPENAKYVRLTANTDSVRKYAVLFYGNYDSQQWVRYRGYRKEIVQDSIYASTGMESLQMVMFGDSITYGQGDANLTPICYCDFANDYLRSNIVSVGLGGSRMSQGNPTAIGLGSFASLCEDIVSTDANAWDDLDAYAAANHADWVSQITKIKNTNWNTVQAIGIWYGANDWHNSVPTGTGYNEDPTKYDGACAYGLKLLLSKYPHLQVIVFTPLFRVDGDDNSDSANSAGLNMDDYGASLQNIRPVFHCPIVNAGNEMGINRYTIYSYTATNDGTHPRKLLGLERIGRFFAEAVKRYIQPY